jgi:pimeloyl-ACP methyl ester carboxylesterase
MIATIILVLALTNAFQTYYQREEKTIIDSANPAIVEKIFLNPVDHFNHLNQKVFAQRYWDYQPDAWNGNICMLYINGEGPGHFRDTDFSYQLGNIIGARIFALEHRYYGKSQPHADWTIPNLRELTHEQGLADIAYFIEKQNVLMGGAKKWVIVGGSYAGAMVAWFRYKYPHLVVGAISSSGVVNSIYDFYMYMEQIKLDLSKISSADCFSIIKSVTTYATNIITSGTAAEKAALKTACGASFLSDKDFMMYFTDTYVGYIQYSNRVGMCSMMVKNVGSKSDMNDKLKEWTNIGALNGEAPADYLVTKESITDIDFKSSSRQWLYQTCTAFSWFQTGHNGNELRYAGIDMDYYFSICDRAYGVKLRPDTNHTNILMGSVDILKYVSNVMFQNGGDDPWQWCGLREDKTIPERNVQVTLVKCDDCGHCIDLKTPSSSNPKEIVSVQASITAAVKKWVGLS